MGRGPRIGLTLLFALLFQGSCAQSLDINPSPDAGNGSTSTGGTTGTGGATATGGATGTGGTATGGSAGAAGSGGGAPTTFTEIYQTILTPMCAGSQCHNPGKQGGMNFATQSSAYTSLKSQVVAGDHEASSLYAIVNAGVMPPIGDNLSLDQRAELASWIDSGATNN